MVSPPLGCLVGTNCSKSRPIWDQKYRSPLCIAKVDVPDLDHLTYNVLNRASMLVKDHVLHWSQRLGQESAFNSMPHAWTKCCNAPTSHRERIQPFGLRLGGVVTVVLFSFTELAP